MYYRSTVWDPTTWSMNPHPFFSLPFCLFSHCKLKWCALFHFLGFDVTVAARQITMATSAWTFLPWSVASAAVIICCTLTHILLCFFTDSIWTHCKWDWHTPMHLFFLPIKQRHTFHSSVRAELAEKFWASWNFIYERKLSQRLTNSQCRWCKVGKRRSTELGSTEDLRIYTQHKITVRDTQSVGLVFCKAKRHWRILPFGNACKKMIVKKTKTKK